MLPVFLTIENQTERLLAERLYLTYKDRMYHVAYAILRKREDAEDTVMDAVYKIVKNIDAFVAADQKRIESLIVIIVRNTAINRYHYNKRRSYSPIDEQCEIADTDASPDVDIVTEENLAALIAKIQALDPIYRDVLVLKYLYEYENEVIASMTGVAESTVRVRLMRARTLLAALLEGRNSQ